MEKFVLLSKDDIYRHRDFNCGKLVLISYARCPIFKTFREIVLQEDALPDYMSLSDAEYAKKKYFPNSIITPYEEAIKMIHQFKVN